MPARLTAYLPEGAAVETVLVPGQALLVGRAPPSDFVLDHPSVSRNHARLEPHGRGWRLYDLASKNGTAIDGEPASGQRLPDHAWLRFGDVLCELALVDESALGETRRRQATQRAASATHERRIEQTQATPELLQGTLAAVVDLAGCERGFLLLNGSRGVVVGAWQGLDPQTLTAPAFSGSRGAVDRALREKRPVVVNDIGQAPWLAGRESVVASGLRCLVCLPLQSGGQVQGLVYADSRSPGPAITTFDLELLEAFAERATLWLVARSGEQALADVEREVRWPGAAGAAA